MNVYFISMMMIVAKRNSLSAVSEGSVALMCAQTLFLSQMFRIFHRNDMLTGGLFHIDTHTNLFNSEIYLLWNAVLVVSVHLCLSTIYYTESMRKHTYVYHEHIPLLFHVIT